MNLVFSTLRDNSFTDNLSEIFNSSELMCDETWKTPAYKMKFSLLLTACILFIYMWNNKGPKTDPWGTPVYSSRVDEHTSW